MCGACGGAVCGGTGMCTKVASFAWQPIYFAYAFLAVAVPAQLVWLRTKVTTWFKKK